MKRNSRPLRAIVTLAAVLAVLVILSVTALAVNFLGLRDLLLPAGPGAGGT